MAWYYGTFACGHDDRINIVGPVKDRERKAKWKFDGLCPECYKKAKEEKYKREAEEASEKAAEMGLPGLVGTEKQVVWANTIRVPRIERLNRNFAKMEAVFKEKGVAVIDGISIEDVRNALNHFIHIHTSSEYWIDARDDQCNMRFVYDEYKKYLETKSKKEEANNRRKSLTAYPECIQKDGVVRLYEDGKKLRARYKRDDDFIRIAKSKGYSWDGESWNKDINEFSGALDDRAGELGNALLEEGFAVEFMNAKQKCLAINGDFATERKRWIKYNSDTQCLAICWDGKNDLLYESALKISTAKWSHEYGSIHVKIEHYEQVKEFAEKQEFKFSKSALKAVDVYKQQN